MKVLVAEVVEGSVHSPLNQGEETFDGIGVDAPAILMPYVFPLAKAVQTWNTFCAQSTACK